MKFYDYLKIKEDNFSLKKVWFLIFIAYFLSVTVRYILFFQIMNNPNFFVDGNVISIWTPDAGLYGFYAKELANGVLYPFNSEYIAGYLIYFITNISGLNIDIVMFYLPAFLSSLIVIPIILITKLYNITLLGFFSALLGTISLSYYSRTHLGYMDTDSLNLFFSLIIIYFFMAFSVKRDFIYLILTIIFISMFYFWYHSSLPIIIGIIIFYILYFLIFDNFNIKIKLITISIIFFIVGYIGYKYNLTHFYERGVDYLNKSQFIELNGLKFKSSLLTVAEAQSSNIFKIAELMLGSFFYFLASVVGLILISIRYRAFIISYILFILGIISVIAGFRFSMYGVGVSSIGVIYSIFVLKNIMINFAEFSQKISIITIRILMSVIFILFIISILKYNKTIRPIFLSEDIKILNELKEKSKKDDFILTWWDYGWPLWYYTGLNTLIDNGKHHEDNYIVSKILFSTNQNFVANASRYFLENYKKFKPKSIISYEFNKKDNKTLLNDLKNNNFKLPINSIDINIMLDERMLSKIIPILYFSNINLKTAREIKKYAIFSSLVSKKDVNKITGKNFIIDLNMGIINIENKKSIALSKIYLKSKKSLKEIDFNNSIGYKAIIYYDYLILLEDELFNSFLIQVFIFDKFDKKYFDLISRSKNIKLLKLKF